MEQGPVSGKCDSRPARSMGRGPASVERDFQPARSATVIDVASLTTAFANYISLSRETVWPTLELPVFNGRSDSWLAFKAAFEELQANYTPSDNVARKRRALRGAVTEAVSSLLISQTKPTEIIRVLERRFGRPKALIKIDKINYAI